MMGSKVNDLGRLADATGLSSAAPIEPVPVSPVPASIPSATGVPVFVFGSNLAGRHGKGAALWARQHRGAVYGQGHGIQGDSYAIPTKGHRMETLSLWMIEGFVQEFLMFTHKYWFRQFQLTPIGCGLAGYRREQIEPMFRGAPDNVIWPPEWSASGMQLREDERSETEGEALQPGPKGTPNPTPDPNTPHTKGGL